MRADELAEDAADPRVFQKIHHHRTDDVLLEDPEEALHDLVVTHRVRQRLDVRAVVFTTEDFHNVRGQRGDFVARDGVADDEVAFGDEAADLRIAQ